MQSHERVNLEFVELLSRSGIGSAQLLAADIRTRSLDKRDGGFEAAEPGGEIAALTIKFGEAIKRLGLAALCAYIAKSASA